MPSKDVEDQQLEKEFGENQWWPNNKSSYCFKIDTTFEKSIVLKNITQFNVTFTVLKALCLLLIKIKAAFW